MAKYLIRSPSQLALLIAFILVVITTSDVLLAEGRTCQRRSKSFLGNCQDSGLCNSICRMEGGISGLCSADGASWGIACFCQFYC